MFNDVGLVPGSVPLCVQRKARDVGFDLSPVSWRKLPSPAQRRLVSMPAAGHFERRAYAGILRWLLQTFDQHDAEPAPLDDLPPWHENEAPEALARLLDGLGVSWDDLGLNARFVVHEAWRHGPDAVRRVAVALQKGTPDCAGPPCVPLDALVRHR